MVSICTIGTQAQQRCPIGPGEQRGIWWVENDMHYKTTKHMITRAHNNNMLDFYGLAAASLSLTQGVSLDPLDMSFSHGKPCKGPAAWAVYDLPALELY